MGGLTPGAAIGTALLLVLAGCGRDEPAAPPSVQVEVGDQQVTVEPTQFCLDGERQRYSSVQPPILEVPATDPIRLTVPADVAERGWSVQIFDDRLEEKLGAVEVDAGTRSFDGVPSSDGLPPAFYLVVVEDKGTACDEFSGAWPVGFIRSTADSTDAPSSTTSSSTTPTSPTP